MSFEKFSSKTVCLNIKDIDTDMIIPSDFLKATDKKGMGKGCFFELRQDPDFPMNDEKLKDAKILITGENFGCGSSREHAPWALIDYGYQVVISSKFADIFRANSEKNGLLLITLPEEQVQKLINPKDKTREITIDLKNNLVTDENNNKYFFEINEFTKMQLLENKNEIDYILNFEKEIEEMDKKRKNDFKGFL